MVKKIGYIIVTALLLVSTTGFVISKHYCNNKLDSVTINIPVEQSYDSKENNCCHNVKVNMILKVDFMQSTVDKIKICTFDLFETSFTELIKEVRFEKFQICSTLSPSPPPGTHLFLSKKQAYLL